MNPYTTRTIDADRFVTEAERITNEASADEWLELYRADAIVEWIVDGAHERHDGIDAIRPAVCAMAEVWRRNEFRVRKQLVCATESTVVLTFDGQFRGRGRVSGTETWELDSGSVVRHRMNAYLDVRPRTSTWAQARVLATDPRVALSAIRTDGSGARDTAPMILAAGRVALAVAALAAPRRFAKAVGIASSPELTYMTRIYGARAAAMGFAYLTGGPAEKERWRRFGLAIDTADTVTGLLHLARRDVPTRAASAMIALTGIYAALEIRTAASQGVLVVNRIPDDDALRGSSHVSPSRSVGSLRRGRRGRGAAR